MEENLKIIEEQLKYETSKPVRVWVGNLAKYNEGDLVGTWLSLPMDEDELDDEIAKVLGTDEEYHLCDYEDDIGLGIDRYSNLKDINSKAQEFEDLDEDDQKKVQVYLKFQDNNFEKALKHKDEIYCHEGTLKDVAYQLVDDGCYGVIPDAISNYIDYDAIVRDLEIEGQYHYDSSQNMTFEFCF